MAPSRRKYKKNGALPHPDTIAGLHECAHQLPLPAPFESPSGLERLAQPPRVFTIGHSNHAADDFVTLLHQHSVTTLIDVRSEPYSRYAPHFGKRPLEACLASASIAYLWMGDTLGGRPADPACYHNGIVRNGNVDYRALAQHPGYQSGLRDLVARSHADCLAIMCSEEDPRRCHRHLLIEPSLREQNVEVLHIRRDGSCEAIEEPDITSNHDCDPQLMLAGFA